MQAMVLAIQRQLCTCFARTPQQKSYRVVDALGLRLVPFFSPESHESTLCSANRPASSRGWLLVQCPSLPANCCTVMYLSQVGKKVERGLLTEANEETQMKDD